LDLLTPYTQNFGTTGNTALSLIYTLYRSPLHTHLDSHSSLAVSRQRIYKSLTVTSKSRMKSSFHSLILFLPLFCNCQLQRLNSIPLLPGSYPGRLYYRSLSRVNRAPRVERHLSQFYSCRHFLVRLLSPFCPSLPHSPHPLLCIYPTCFSFVPFL
jgi:hypothetical protein